jgi:hypothetical protein
MHLIILKNLSIPARDITGFSGPDILQKKQKKLFRPGDRHPDVDKGVLVHIGKFRQFAVAAPDPEECRVVKRDPCGLDPSRGTHLFFFLPEAYLVLLNSVSCFPAAGMGVLVSADHVG